MASIFQDSTGTYYIRFRVAGINAKRSLQTNNEREARSAKLRVEDTLKDIRLGRLEFPDHVDPVTFVLGGGRIEKNATSSALNFGKLCKKYLESIPEGAKGESTLYGEKIHIKHLKRIIGFSKQIRTINVGTVQDYVSDRSKEKTNKKRPISASTIKKELVTLGQIWKFAKISKLVTHDLDIPHVKLPKRKQKPRFHTLNEVKARLPKLTTDAEKDVLIDSIYLKDTEVIDLMTHVSEVALHPWIEVAFYFAAFTGARRSEIIRCLVDDVDLESGRIEIREKKRVHSLEFSFRTVDIHPRFLEVLQKWIQDHPTGGYLLCHKNGRAITVDQATHHFNQTLKGSEWEILKGWHVLRHSFASICASKGIRENVISEWMGHETEEMKARYRHLFPEDTSAEMAKFV